MYYTNVLVSVNRRRTYVGITHNLKARLEAHNNGLVKSSRKFRPYVILFSEEFSSIEEARRREIYFKSRTGRRQLKKYF